MHNFLQGSTQIKQQKGSKSKFDLQLPRIAKGDSNEQFGPIALRFHWLTLPKDYSTISNQQIQAQYNQLRRDLILLNDQAVKNVERISTKSGKKSKKTIDNNKVGELNDRQSENNSAIIARLRMELQQLQKRITSIEQTSKDQIESEIEEAKEQIIYLRHKNKEIQQKSKNIGSYIETGDEVFSQIKKLQIDLSIADKKKIKLELRSKQITQNLQKIKKNQNELTGEAQQAQTFIEQNIQLSRVDKEQKKLEFIYRQRTYNLQIVKKNEESLQNIKQQKYHQYLKQLQDLTAKIKQIDMSINSSQEKHLNQKAQIIDYQQKLKVAIEMEKSRRNKSVIQAPNTYHQKQNSQAKKETIETLTKNHSLVSKIKRNQSAQKQSQQGPKKMRLLKIKLQKQTNKLENDKMNHTISAITNKNIVKTQIASKKFDQSNLSYQQPTNQKINTIYFPQNKNQESQKYKEQSNYSQNIEQDIQSSFAQALPKSMPKENFKKQTSNIIIKQAAESLENPIVSQKSMNDKLQSQQEDEDIRNFKKSIQVERSAPFNGLKNVDIALGQIQQTIKQQQTKSRLNKFSQEKPIQQQEESIVE